MINLSAGLYLPPLGGEYKLDAMSPVLARFSSPLGDDSRNLASSMDLDAKRSSRKSR